MKAHEAIHYLMRLHVVKLTRLGVDRDRAEVAALKAVESLLEKYSHA